MAPVTIRMAQTQGWLCFYCATTMTHATATKDHIVPKSKGGSHDQSNLVAACLPCNAAKADLDAELFIILRLQSIDSGWWPPGAPVPYRVWRKRLREHLSSSFTDFINQAAPGGQQAA